MHRTSRRGHKKPVTVGGGTWYVCVPHQNPRGNLKLMGLLGGDEAVTVETPQRSLVPATTWGHTGKTAIFDPGSGPHWPAGALMSHFRPPGLWEINVRCLSHKFMVLCYSSPNRLRRNRAPRTGIREKRSFYSIPFLVFHMRMHHFLKIIVFVLTRRIHLSSAKQWWALEIKHA